MPQTKGVGRGYHTEIFRELNSFVVSYGMLDGRCRAYVSPIEHLANELHPKSGELLLEPGHRLCPYECRGHFIAFRLQCFLNLSCFSLAELPRILDYVRPSRRRCRDNRGLIRFP